MNMVTLDRESATTEDLFEIITALLSRLERAEEIICALAGARLVELGDVAAPPPQITKDLSACLVEYVLLIDRARENAARDAAFLNARE